MFKNVIGLIVEYNPFHNGHLHHIQEIDRLFEDKPFCCVLLGDEPPYGISVSIWNFRLTFIRLMM